MSRTILSIWAWLTVGIIVIVWVPLTFVVFIATAPFDKGRYRAGWMFRRLCVVHTWINPLWSFRTSGLEITDPRRPYVVVANHESCCRKHSAVRTKDKSCGRLYSGHP